MKTWLFINALTLPHTKKGQADKAKRSKGHGRVGHVVFSLKDVDKHFDDGETLFTDATLGAFDGAKIGVVGVNGSGKSSLLKIIAGVDEDFEGERVVADGIRMGYLSQEPELVGV